MKNMILIVICIMMGSQIYEQASATDAVGSVQTTTSKTDAKTGGEQEHQLVVSDKRVYGYIENVHVSKEQNIYDILTQEETKAFDWSTVPEIMSSGTTREEPLQGWKPSLIKDKDCECGKDCLCAPGVCKKGHCKHSYAVIFGAKWCRFCPRMKPVMKELKRRGYIVFYIDTDQHPVVVERFQIRRWPTTVIMHKGKPTRKFSGVTTASKIAKHLKTYKEQGLEPEKDE